MFLTLAGGVGLWREYFSSRAIRAAAFAPPPDLQERRLLAAVQAHPNDAGERLQLGNYYEEAARPFEALWEYAEAERLAPADPAVPMRMAMALRAGGEIDLAVARLIEARRARPDDLQVRRELADLYLDTAESQHARSVMEEQPEAVRQGTEALVDLGRAREASGNDEGAEAAFQQALSLDGKNDRAYYRLGRLYLRQRQSEKARDAFFHAMFYDQRRPEYPFSAGMAYSQEPGPASLDRSLRFFQDALRLDPNDAAAHFQAGLALERLGKRSPALTQYSLATVSDPNDSEPLPALSRALAAVGRTPDAFHFQGRYEDLKDRPAEAVREYQRMQTVVPDDVEPALLIGQVYLRTRQSDRAAAVTEAALQRHPHAPELLERLAVLNINRGDWPAARKLLQAWLSEEPKASRPCWLLGRCAIGELNDAEAVSWLEKAAASEPQNPHYLGYLGAALLKQDTPASRARAADVLAHSVTLAPGEAEYQDLYGQALEQLGRYEEARRAFLRALDADPQRIAALLAVSRLARRLREPGAAALFPTLVRSVQSRVSEEERLWPHVWQHPQDSAGRLQLARFLCRTARLAQARDELEQLQPARSSEAQKLFQSVQRCLEVQ